MSDLEDLLLELLAMPCVTGEEGPIAEWVEQRYRGREQIRRVGNSVVVGEEQPDVLLVGHLDVVPPTEEDRSARHEGDRIVGRGASDMKSGVAVALHAFEDAAARAGPYTVGLVCYAGEEGAHAGNELRQVLDEIPELGRSRLAVVLEPTDLAVQLGCMGGLHAELTFAGKAAHSARPWHGENALTKAGAFLTELHDRAPEQISVDGLVFIDVLTATGAWTDNARNVVPDRFTVNVNYRFAPDRSLDEAERHVRELVGGRADIAITDRAPAAPPRRDAALVRRFIEVARAPVEPKQAWTDVARFAEMGVPALNYGPGLTSQAHRAGEYVPVENLHRAREALAGFLGASEGGGR